MQQAEPLVPEVPKVPNLNELNELLSQYDTYSGSDLTREVHSLARYHGPENLYVSSVSDDSIFLHSVLQCLNPKFRVLKKQQKSAVVKALSHWPHDIQKLSDLINRNILVFLTCSNKKLLRVSGTFKNRHFIILLSDGNGLMWHPVRTFKDDFDRYTFTYNQGLAYANMAVVDACDKYEKGAIVSYQGNVYKIIKTISEKNSANQYLLESTSDASIQEIASAEDLRSSVAKQADGPQEIINRRIQIERQTNGKIKRYAQIAYDIDLETLLG